MHEASIMRELLAAAAESAGAGRRVLEVHVDVGLLTGVSPDALAFYFEALQGDTLGPQARLDVRLVPLRAACTGCGVRHEQSELAWTCVACGGGLTFDNGAELTLRQLVVERG